MKELYTPSPIQAYPSPVMVQTPKHKSLLILKSLHTNNNDYYHI